MLEERPATIAARAYGLLINYIVEISISISNKNYIWGRDSTAKGPSHEI
jgi:hypothetical protein